jgi:hypothetical protein
MMKKNITSLLCPALFVIASVLAMPVLAADVAVASAQDNSATGSAGAGATNKMEILRQKLSADKRLVVADNMNLTDSEAKAFWPIYDAYQQDLYKINLRMVKVINDYALAYNKGAVLNDTAKKLLDESIAIELAEAQLKQSYVPKLGKALPAAKVARYIQIENKIRAIIRYELAGAIPLVE